MAQASITANLIQDVQIGSQDPARIASSAYAICDTPAATADKVIAMTGFNLMQGVTIHVKFDNANTATGVRLNVETSGLHPVIVYGGNNAPNPTWSAGAVVAFTYDGTSWVMNTGLDTDTIYSVQNTYDGTSEDPISGKGVKAAIETLDITAINNTASKTVATITEQDGIVGATFQDIAIAESQVTNLTTDLAAKAPIANPTFTGTVTLPATGPQSDNEAATKKYVDDKHVGLTGAMHFIPTIEDENHTITITKIAGTNGAPDKYTITGTGLPTNYTPVAGDIIIHAHQEYVYGGDSTLGWRLLGDEGSYALKTNTQSVIKDVTLSNSLPSLTITPNTTIPNITSIGLAPTMTKENHTIKTTNVSSITPTHVAVDNGTLKITLGSGANFTDVTATEIKSWNAGSATTLGTATNLADVLTFSAGTGASFATKTTQTVVVP